MWRGIAGIFVKDHKLLLQLRSETDRSYAGYWAPPAGHVKPGEAYEHALKREMHEELSVHVTKFRLLYSVKDLDPTSGDIFHVHIFLCREWSGEIKGTKEQRKLNWVPVKELGKYKMFDSERKLFERLIKKKIIC